ncbi:transmembrane protein 176 isoform X1 [Etheostoma spectabile]|uniref:transmembrane protein 176 isoform X1 n=1 Tax=Etheostoma spectabile TaxID=54343 RepID=UPI0013AF6E29|nr:membrane-spanning 4-domains subfamily A member 12 isoform X1 [Etheostoma spectabile]
MAVAVHRDLTVQVLQDGNAAKLTDRQQAVHAAVKRGDPKCLGVSQVMLGLMVMSYSIPLHFTEVTEVVRLGVPWWSGLTFIATGVVAIVLDKHSTMKILQVCLLASLGSTVLSVVAVIIYSVDIDRIPEVPCVNMHRNGCDVEYYATELSRGIKSALLVFTLAQTAISAVLGFLLLRHRRGFAQYASLTQAASSSPTSLIPPNLN